MFLYAAVLCYDAVATVCGLFGAVLLAASPDVPRALVLEARAAAPLLVLGRIGAVVATGGHRWPSREAGLAEAARLAFAGIAASLALALVHVRLPWSVYALELILTTSFMAALRFGSPLARAFASSSSASPAATTAASEHARRALNVLVASVALVVTFPAWILIALAIKVTSRGPVFYAQERVGIDLRRSGPLPQDPRRKRDLGGRTFMMYKFRTMRVDAESSTGAVWAAKRDPRVTPIGGVLRHYRLDELPQLINVLRGEMNIVGPRPERPSIFAELRTKISNYHLRQQARPGITGYAQVNLEADASIEDVTEKLKYDLEYLSRQGVATDLRILAKTVLVVLFRDRMLAARAPRAAALPLLSKESGGRSTRAA